MRRLPGEGYQVSSLKTAMVWLVAEGGQSPFPPSLPRMSSSVGWSGTPTTPTGFERHPTLPYPRHPTLPYPLHPTLSYPPSPPHEPYPTQPTP